MPNLRHERVRELLKREIGEAIRREFNVDEATLVRQITEAPEAPPPAA